MKKYILTLSFLVLVGTVCLGWAKEKPNVILINADDLGYGDLSCYGATKLQTPNVDRLAKEGRRFTDAHSASAVCSSSRYGLMTGQYPIRRNFWGPIPFTQGLTIDVAQPTLASVLKSAGYATAAIGKWHLGFGKGKTNWNKPLKPGPIELGFDYYFGMPTVNSGPPAVYVENHEVVAYDPNDPFVTGKISATQKWPEKGGYKAIGGAKKAFKRYRDEFVGTTFAEKAVAWIKERNGRKNRNPSFSIWRRPTFITRLLPIQNSRERANADCTGTSSMNWTGSSGRCSTSWMSSASPKIPWSSSPATMGGCSIIRAKKHGRRDTG
jgi:arylsulfatase A-like enzyme